MSNVVRMLLYLLDKACLLKILDEHLSCFITVHTRILSAKLVEMSIAVKHANLLKVVTLSYLKVVRVVAGSYLNASGTEFTVNVLVCNNRDGTVDERKNYLLANKVSITLVIGMNRNGAVSEIGLVTGSCN